MASPFVEEEPISPLEVSINRKFFSPTRNIPFGMLNTPATSPAAVVVKLPIE